MTTLVFTVQFHQPFLVRSGQAAGGLDALARRDAPLPASSLKGAMRHAAQHALGVNMDLVGEVFGREGRRSGRLGQGAWAWTDAGPLASFRHQARARNRVDPSTGSAHAEALAITEEWWQVGEALFAVELLRGLPLEALHKHTVVLNAASYAVTALGSWRNRSMGTVTVRPAAPRPDLPTEFEAMLR